MRINENEFEFIKEEVNSHLFVNSNEEVNIYLYILIK